MQNPFGILLLFRHIKSNGRTERVGTGVVKDVCHDLHEKLLVQYGPYEPSELLSWHDIAKLTRQKKLKLGTYIWNNGLGNVLDGGISRLRKIQDDMVEQAGIYLWVIPEADCHFFFLGSLQRVYTNFTHGSFRMICNSPMKAASVVERSIDLTSNHGHFMIHEECFDFYELTSSELDKAIDIASGMTEVPDDARLQSQARAASPPSACTSEQRIVNTQKLDELMQCGSDSSDVEGVDLLKYTVLYKPYEVNVTDDEKVDDEDSKRYASRVDRDEHVESDTVSPPCDSTDDISIVIQEDGVVDDSITSQPSTRSEIFVDDVVVIPGALEDALRSKQGINGLSRLQEASGAWDERENKLIVVKVLGLYMAATRNGPGVMCVLNVRSLRKNSCNKFTLPFSTIFREENCGDFSLLWPGKKLSEHSAELLKEEDRLGQIADIIDRSISTKIPSVAQDTSTEEHPSAEECCSVCRSVNILRSAHHVVARSEVCIKFEGTAKHHEELASNEYTLATCRIVCIFAIRASGTPFAIVGDNQNDVVNYPIVGNLRVVPLYQLMQQRERCTLNFKSPRISLTPSSLLARFIFEHNDT
ncbi:hypothetical protein CYMTET_55183 [Cymbomonas tetramitiformis]|uniref:Uncharacterized protein n=1 Tax=Cymbomonas tetramitiformis TaxID=36881 RepID=A0AAE0BER5_9CHLO|nr:hypothetical protein CYMTET_55183 [Cymbomonas tetramitiformis]|eukprot:gene108-158_t